MMMAPNTARPNGELKLAAPVVAGGAEMVEEVEVVGVGDVVGVVVFVTGGRVVVGGGAVTVVFVEMLSVM